MHESPLLDKVRHICRFIQSSPERSLEFVDGARMLKEVLNANVLIVSPSGKVWGYSLSDKFDCEIFQQVVLDNEAFPERYNEEILLTAQEPRVNIKQKDHYCVYKRELGYEEEISCRQPEIITTIVPIIGGGNRLGTLVIHRFGEELSADDLVLAENGATLIGMEVMRNKVDKTEKDMRHKAIAEVAFDSLSYSELEAIEEIFRELNGKEGIIVASKIADNLGITRSVIVNALRKFESAGIIDSRSLGMKGTFIKIKHPVYQEEIEKRISSENPL